MHGLRPDHQAGRLVLQGVPPLVVYAMLSTEPQGTASLHVVPIVALLKPRSRARD